MKLSLIEVNAVATAAYSGMWPPSAHFFQTFFHFPMRRARELAVRQYTPADLRRIKGALDRASLVCGATTEGAAAMKCIEDIKSQAVRRVTDDEAIKLVKSCHYKYVPKSRWKAKRKEAAEATK